MDLANRFANQPEADDTQPPGIELTIAQRLNDGDEALLVELATFSPYLARQVKEKGTEHHLADKTLSDLRMMYR